MPRLITCLAAVALLSGCVSIPRPLEGDFQAFQPDQSTQRSIGARVRWGGIVIQTEPGQERTCIEVLAKELARDYRPRTGDRNFGRFMACKTGFQDPALFAEGREVTVTGRLEGFRDGAIGEYVYQYPVVDTDVIHLWPERTDQVYYYRHDPWYWGPYYHRWYFRGGIILTP